MDPGHGHSEGDLVPQVKGPVRDSFDEHLDLLSRDTVHPCRRLASSAVENDKLVARLGAEGGGGVVGFFGRKRVGTHLQVRAIEAMQGHGRDYHCRRVRGNCN